MIKVITDSTADLPIDYLEQYHIGMIPLQVNIEGKEYVDKVNISINELYDALRQGKDTKTSQPNPLNTFDILSKEAEQGHDLIVITLSSKLSGTYQTIYFISKEVKEKYPHVKIEIIDSLGGSGIAGLMAIQAAKMIEKHHSFEEIVSVLKELSFHGEHIFTISDLKNLIKSGRINKASAYIGNILLVKPILHVVNGEIQLHSKVRGINKALNKLATLVFERMKDFPNQTIAVMHANDIDMANQLCNLIKNRLGDVNIIVDQIGSVLGTHLGNGGVGIFFFNKKPNSYYL